MVKLDNGTAAQATYARVQNIESDTLMFIDAVSQRAYSSNNIFKQSFKPDILKDSILATIATDGSTNYSINVVNAITAGIVGSDGAAGATGLKTATGQLFFQQESASAPAIPSNAITFNFSNGSFTGN